MKRLEVPIIILNGPRHSWASSTLLQITNVSPYFVKPLTPSRMFLTLALGSVVIFIIFWLLDKLTLSPKDRYVLITGCDTGFGNALAKSLDLQGCYVFATCLTRDGAAALKESTSEHLRVVMMDVLSSESIKEAFEEVKKDLPQGAG